MVVSYAYNLLVISSSLIFIDYKSFNNDSSKTLVG